MLPLRAVKEEMRMTTRSWPPTQGRGMAVGPGGMSSPLRQVITGFFHFQGQEKWRKLRAPLLLLTTHIRRFL